VQVLCKKVTVFTRCYCAGDQQASDSKLHREYASIANRNNGQAHVVKRGRGAGGGFGATGELGPLIVITCTKLQMRFSATRVPQDGAHVLLAVESSITDMCIAQSMPAK
jgi:hypothetical protein